MFLQGILVLFRTFFRLISFQKQSYFLDKHRLLQEQRLFHYIPGPVNEQIIGLVIFKKFAIKCLFQF